MEIGSLGDYADVRSGAQFGVKSVIEAGNSPVQSQTVVRERDGVSHLGVVFVVGTEEKQWFSSSK